MIIMRDRAKFTGDCRVRRRESGGTEVVVTYSRKLSGRQEMPMSNQEPATILLIDDHPMLRTGENNYQYGTRYHRGWRSE